MVNVQKKIICEIVLSCELAKERAKNLANENRRKCYKAKEVISFSVELIKQQNQKKSANLA